VQESLRPRPLWTAAPWGSRFDQLRPVEPVGFGRVSQLLSEQPNRRGMTVDPVIRELLDKVADAQPMNEMSVGAARAFSQAMGAGKNVEGVQAVEDITMGRTPVRIYTGQYTEENAPIFVWLHGGGFVLGDVERAEPITRRLANRLKARIASVDYRLAPEHPFPAALEDGRAVLDWAVGLKVPIGLGGDSAGANVAARLAVEARDRGIVISHQLLVYPWLDMAMSQPSINELSDGYFLTRDLLRWFSNHYLPEGLDRRDPMISPFYVEDLSDVAPATIVTAEYDPLRDEGRLYAARLREAGVKVDDVCFPGMIHGFFAFFDITPLAGQANDLAVANISADLTSAGALGVER
jgi:acetyl esterase